MVVLAIRLLKPVIADVDERIVIEGFWYLVGVKTQDSLREASADVEPSVFQNELWRKIDTPVIFW